VTGTLERRERRTNPIIVLLATDTHVLSALHEDVDARFGNDSDVFTHRDQDAEAAPSVRGRTRNSTGTAASRSSRRPTWSAALPAATGDSLVACTKEVR
jgi:hypothetical protein